MNNRLRIGRLKEILLEKKIEAFLVTKPENVYYLTGLLSTAAIMLIGNGKELLITDSRYIGRAIELTSGCEPILCQSALSEAVISEAQKAGIKKIWFEEKHTSVELFKNLSSHLEMVESGSLVEELRLIKDESELDLIKKASVITKEAMKKTINEVKIGMTEREIAAIFDCEIIRSGADSPAFETIVASGKNSAIPHHETSEKKIEDGDIVLIDAGARYRHYCSDMTRSFIVGKRSSEAEKLITTVKEAYEVAIKSINESANFKDIDFNVRNYIEKAGYKGKFTHNLGHGIGLDVHEAPVLGPKSTTKAAKGMVFSIEPGIYIDVFGGVRIEDTVAITDNGVEILTR